MMAIGQTGQSAEVTHQGCTSKGHWSHLLLAAGLLVVGATLSIGLYFQLAKPTGETSRINQQQQLTVQEDLYSLGCYVDDKSSHVMPYVYTDDALTPLVSSATLC